jgi:hypothetical protein
MKCVIFFLLVRRPRTTHDLDDADQEQRVSHQPHSMERSGEVRRTCGDRGEAMLGSRLKVVMVVADGGENDAA